MRCQPAQTTRDSSQFACDTRLVAPGISYYPPLLDPRVSLSSTRVPLSKPTCVSLAPPRWYNMKGERQICDFVSSFFE
ncbi:unnamed protein product, partial [Nesidiocoris tenuis]